MMEVETMEFIPETYLPRERWRAVVDELLRVVRQDPLELATDLENAIIWTLAEVGGLFPDDLPPVVD